MTTTKERLEAAKSRHEEFKAYFPPAETPWRDRALFAQAILCSALEDLQRAEESIVKQCTVRAAHEIQIDELQQKLAQYESATHVLVPIDALRELTYSFDGRQKMEAIISAQQEKDS